MLDNKEDVEKEDDSVSEEMKEPFNPNNIKVRLQAIPIYSMVERIHHHEIDLQTAFQRKEGLWDDKQQSRLIESILIRFPLPVFYFDGSDTNNWLVIDGLQRLSSLKRFMDTKELKLTGLEFLDKLEGKGWNNLDRPQQRQINETSLQCYILDEGDKDVKFNIFKRINTGGLNLSDQEIRHAMFQKVAKFLETLAESFEFTSATQNRIPKERMLDREFVNRFLAFHILPIEEYTKKDDLDSFMNRALVSITSSPESKQMELESDFKASMLLAKEIFGEYAFCKNTDRKQINKALFEVMSVSFAKLNTEQRQILLDNKEAFKTEFYNAVENKFLHHLTAGGKPSITTRHTIFNEIVSNILKSNQR